MITAIEKMNPVQLAWLVRSDIRGSAKQSDPISLEFLLWWSVEGRGQYAEWSSFVSRELSELLYAHVDWPHFNGLGVSPLLLYLMKRRTDLSDTFDLSTDAGQWQAISWMFAHGIHEHNLVPLIDERTRRLLNQPVPFFTEDVELAITWIMFFIWRSSPVLQSTFPLGDKVNRRNYSVWFYTHAVTERALFSLIDLSVIAELKATTRVGEVHLPRIALAMWCARPDLSEAFNLQTHQGRMDFASWSDAAWEIEPGLRWLAPSFSHVADQPAHQLKQTDAFGVNLIGFAYGELGLGEDLRMAAKVCSSAGIPFSIVNINPGNSLRQNDRILHHSVLSSTQSSCFKFPVNLFCLTGFDFVRVVLEKGPLLSNFHNIGWLPWELPVWPAAWRGTFELLDEVWAATTFTLEMYRKVLPPLTPLKHVPMAACVERVSDKQRAHFNLPIGKCLILFVFDGNSSISRKNPAAALNAFQQAFPEDESVNLVIKCMNADGKAMKEFIELCRGDSRVKVINGTMDREDILALIKSCDIYLSLHRAEGFGRTLVEAMLFGKPVVATNFSGNVDFMADKITFPVAYSQRKVLVDEYPFVDASDNAWWADPNLPSAAAQLRRARASLNTQNSTHITRYAAEKFSPTAVSEKVGPLLFEAYSLAIKASPIKFA